MYGGNEVFYKCGRLAERENFTDLHLKKDFVICENQKEQSLKLKILEEAEINCSQSEHQRNPKWLVRLENFFERFCESTAKELLNCAIKVVITVLLICRFISSTHT